VAPRLLEVVQMAENTGQKQPGSLDMGRFNGQKRSTLSNIRVQALAHVSAVLGKTGRPAGTTDRPSTAGHRHRYAQASICFNPVCIFFSCSTFLVVGKSGWRVVAL